MKAKAYRPDAPRTCVDCGETKPTKAFHWHERKNWLDTKCADCRNEYRRELRRHSSRHYVDRKTETERWSFAELLRWWPEQVYSYWQALACLEERAQGADD